MTHLIELYLITTSHVNTPRTYTSRLLAESHLKRTQWLDILLLQIT